MCINQQTQVEFDEEICEIILFKHTLQSIPEKCQLTSLKGPLFLFDYLSSNNWLITTTTSSFMDITCNNLNKNVQIPKSFLLKLDSDCLAFIGTLKLRSEFFHSSNTTIIIPETPLFINCCNNERPAESNCLPVWSGRNFDSQIVSRP